MQTAPMISGNYDFIPGVMQYSAGVAAMAGYRIERVCFSKPVPLVSGFELISSHLDAIGRPKTAFCACELRSPGQFSESGFVEFNTGYANILRDWGIMSANDNPVARSNVCPEIDPPDEPSFHAFCYTVPDTEAPASFVIAGSGEAPEGHEDYRSVTVRLGDTSLEGLQEKAKFVLAEMERRMAFFGATWNDVSATQLYTIFDVFPFLAEEVYARGAARHGLVWHYNRPPVEGLDFEMDCRRVAKEHVIQIA